MTYYGHFVINYSKYITDFSFKVIVMVTIVIIILELIVSCAHQLCLDEGINFQLNEKYMPKQQNW